MLDSKLDIGGYFGFSLPNFGQFPYPEAVKYNSARSAFFDLLNQNNIKKIWMPKFICDSMIEPLIILGVEIQFYDLDEKFYPKIPSHLENDSYLFYINYFGICTSIQQRLLEDYSSDQIIFDHSQAFFVTAFDSLATIYSIRKFFPVAEGGLLISKVVNNPNYASREIEEMIVQYKHCFIRRLSSASQGYELFKNNEISLNGCIPKKLSGITEELIHCFEYKSIQSKRLENFKFLHAQLKSINKLHIDIDSVISPLTYPLLLDSEISNKLISHNIYTPTYWIDSLKRVEPTSFEYQLILNITHLICDQRYSIKEMQFQINKIKEYL